MKITTSQLRQIIREEIIRLKSLNEEDAGAKIRKHQDAIKKLEKAMADAKTQAQKDAIQKRMVTRKQWLANFKKKNIVTKGKK